MGLKSDQPDLRDGIQEKLKFGQNNFNCEVYQLNSSNRQMFSINVDLGE